MEPALEVIHRALQGDPDAQSFLERTTDVYVLDVTDPSNPKTYGCWNFIHQAMNEVERYEAKYAMANRLQDLIGQASLVSHARLLAFMALKAARRSPARDQALVAECISNAEQLREAQSQLKWLSDLNVELREIVMARIAAMAFDFSFHRKTGPNGYSAFSDRVVMESMCAVLAANAVSAGPHSIIQFATEWIIPSSTSLPAYPLASVALNLALEGCRKTSPAGTKDALQQLSVQIIKVVLAPILGEAVSESSTTSAGMSTHQESSQVAATSIRAINNWCHATDLSLPQIKHVCGKVNIDIIGKLNDAMYSDSTFVVDALADLIEATAVIVDEPTISEGRMNQVRHIIQVDEVSFRSNFSAHQLKLIETKEMESIVDELISAVGLQRFRFTERQMNGDHDLCRNLTRIAASVCSTFLDVGEHSRNPEHSIVNLLLKAAMHPSTNISAMAIEVLTRLVGVSGALAHELLPLLQRSAIIPHQLTQHGFSVTASDRSSVNFHEFLSFRGTILTDALLACWHANGDKYMKTCSVAIEEFCTENTTPEISLHLEAALFCVEAVGKAELSSDNATRHDDHLKRISVALSRKASSMVSNPLTLAKMCSFIASYVSWYESEGDIQMAGDLTLSAFQMSVTWYPDTIGMREVLRESSISPVSEASCALRDVLKQSPESFSYGAKIDTLGGAWEALFAASDRPSTIPVEDCAAFGDGLCNVLSIISDPNMKIRAFEAVVLPILKRLDERSMRLRDSLETTEITSILESISDEIMLLASISRSFTDACLNMKQQMQSGCHTSQRHAPVLDSILGIVQGCWPNIINVAEKYSNEDCIATALLKFLTEFLPPTCENDRNVAVLRKVMSVASSMQKKVNENVKTHESLCCFIELIGHYYGSMLDQTVLGDFGKEIVHIMENLILDEVTSVWDKLGPSWIRSYKQDQGQPAFESKPSEVQQKLDVDSSECLEGLLSMLCSTMEYCPEFLLRLPAVRGVDKDDDPLMRRAFISAVACLNASDFELVRTAISYLKSMMKHLHSSNEHIRSFLSECGLLVRNEAIARLLHGCCGKYDSNMLPDVALLLLYILQTTSENDLDGVLSQTLQPDHFFLGYSARNVAFSILAGCARHIVGPHELTCFLEAVWDLHRVDDVEALPVSDKVAYLVQKYGQQRQ